MNRFAGVAKLSAAVICAVAAACIGWVTGPSLHAQAVPAAPPATRTSPRTFNGGRGAGRRRFTQPTINVVEPRVHDPAFIRMGDSFYLFSTNGGLPIWRSHDLIHWDRLGTVFPRSQPFPSWGPTEVPGTRGVWAPDISFFAGKYHLYYAVSTFGKNHSAIGLATNVTLDPAAPGYHWMDDGPVFESKATDDFNAIDPNLVMDDKGVPWLVFGSFWGGIKARRLEAATGKLDPADTTLYSLAARPDTKTKAIEGAFVIKHDSYWYLFVSFDFCCRGVNSNYRVMVGRSRELLGPYIDKNGTAMMAGGGTQILAGDGKRIRGPGHCAVVHDGDKWWMSNHFYDADDNGASKLQIHPLTWDDAGWPVVGAPLAPAK